jgi:small subunit ribosomal protein S5
MEPENTTPIVVPVVAKVAEPVSVPAVAPERRGERSFGHSGRPSGRGGFRQEREKSEFEEKVLLIRRVSKKTSGGNYISFSALVAIGDRKGKVGVGLGRGLEVPQAIKKGISFAKKHMIEVPIYKMTIPHQVKSKYKSSKIILKPAPAGVGLKVGSVVRSILSLAGVSNASGKIIGTRNKITNSYGVIKALELLKKKN